eukprot:4831677-Prymnesium_polylepis.1
MDVAPMPCERVARARLSDVHSDQAAARALSYVAAPSEGWAWGKGRADAGGLRRAAAGVHA